MTCYDTAARCQEMVDLTLGNLVLDSQSPCVYLTGKGETTSVVPLMPKTVLHLKHYLDKFHPADSRKKNDYLFFTSSHGKRHRMSEDNVAAFVKQYGEQAKMKCAGISDRIHPHMLRQYKGYALVSRWRATDAALRYPWSCAA